VDSELWERAKRLFAEARELDAEAWDAFLDERCGDDAELRQELAALLAGDREATHFLEPPPALGQDPYVGRRIGPYQVLHRLGYGGMGVVYLAERDDEAFRKRVALKLLRLGRRHVAAMREITRRFETERRILAALDHPSIAKILDGGSTADGMPYFVMEYVEGQPIDEYCDLHTLTIVERLELFAKVCEAVHFAHQNLVVHRDLKPDNILITPDGEPKLLDFGIAKILNPDLSFRGVVDTLPAQRPLTPDFASPEQVRGDPMTTASDVYMLGVLLYLLLAGHRPYRVDSASLVEMERVVCDTEPERLSTAVRRREEIPRADGTTVTLTPELISKRRGDEPGRLRRRLAGDLENVVAMAMRKEPRHRYSSAAELAAEVRRYLAGRPVVAAGDSLVYRGRKFVRRHRLGVAASAAFLAAAVAFGAVMAVQHGRLEASLARERFVTDFLVDLFALADPFAEDGGTVSARELIDRGAARLEAEFREQPAVRARLMTALGAIYRELGLFERAATLLESALELRRATWGDDHPEYADSLDEWALLLHARAEQQAAEPPMREALEIRRRHLGEYSAEVAESLQHLAVLLQDQGDLDGAERLFRDVLERRRALHGQRHPEVAETLSDLALTLKRQGARDEAERCLREALQIFRQTVGSGHLYVAFGLNNLAFFLREQGDLEAAESHYREALAILRRHLDDDHPLIGTNLHNLAGILHARGDLSAAEALYEEALEIRRRRLGPDHPMVANTLFKLAELFAGRGDTSEATRLAREAHDILRSRLGPDHPYTRQILELLVRLSEAAP